MSIRLMTAVWDADLSKVEWIIAAHVAPATKTRPERLMPPEKGMLSAMDKSVLLALADHAADDGSSVYPSIATWPVRPSFPSAPSGRPCGTWRRRA